MPLNVLLVPLGSHGDVHPLIGIGIRLKERGHRVRVIVNGHFESIVREAGLEFIELGTDAEYRQMASNPQLWARRKGPATVIKALGELTEPVYNAIVVNNEPGNTVVVASTLAMGARIAQDRFAIPTVTTHLQPLDFWSAIDPPRIPGLLLGKNVPRWLIRFQFVIAHALVLDRLAGPVINGLRTRLGLPPVKRILQHWWNSPDRVIGLFPDWFAPPQADWPAQTRLTGFPLYDESGVTRLPAPLEEFLAAGSPPIAFTFGSAMWHAQTLLEQSARTCAIINRRGILLTRHREQVPAPLPPGVIHVDFAPFSELLPRCAALVHHGGIGTSSQGLAAGVPQLVVPHAHDQPDNAARLVRLGVARTLEPKRYEAPRVAEELRALLNDPQVGRACEDVASRFVNVDSIGQTCDLIEEVATGARHAISQVGSSSPF